MWIWVFLYSLPFTNLLLLNLHEVSYNLGSSPGGFCVRLKQEMADSFLFCLLNAWDSSPEKDTSYSPRTQTLLQQACYSSISFQSVKCHQAGERPDISSFTVLLLERPCRWHLYSFRNADRNRHRWGNLQIKRHSRFMGQKPGSGKIRQDSNIANTVAGLVDNNFCINWFLISQMNCGNEESTTIVPM